MTAATLFLVGCGQRQHTEQVTLVRIDTVKTANTCSVCCRCPHPTRNSVAAVIAITNLCFI